MYIKQVIIEGFRSYREQTVIEPFSPEHNVIVGRNGCGKSNFFKAIQFVLSDEYTNLKEEDRIALLHEGSGPKVMSGFVEIIFDNTDGRLPVEKDEVSIKRAIGMKKDQYFLDKKVVSKGDIMNFLETAGFSRNNPYYIVKQGKINEISIAKDSFRLKILKEVAGSNVYDEKKEESGGILKEAEDKRQSILDVLKAIEDRLSQLEVEKEELKEFQKWDKMKRSIEYTIHNKELENVQNKLIDLQKSRSESSTKSNKIYEELSRISDESKETEKLIQDLRLKETNIKDELDQLNEEKSNLLSRRARFEFDIHDAQDECRQAAMSSDLAKIELSRIDKQIKRAEDDLSKILPEYDNLRSQESELTQERDLCEQKRNEIYAKQGRSTRFGTKEDRDRWIKNELKIINKAVEDKNNLSSRLNEELRSDKDRTDKFRTEIEHKSKDLEKQQQAIEDAERKNFDLQHRKEEAQTKRNNMWRQETQLTQDLNKLKEEYSRCEQNMRSSIGRTILQGIESIKQILRQCEEEKTNSDVLKGYFGLLIDAIDCNKSFYTAIESAVSNRLFYHVVESDTVAMKLLKMMNQQKLHGEVNYLPLNVIKTEHVTYPNTTDAEAIIKLLKYDQKVEKGVKHVFDKILLCRTSDAATQLAKQTQMDCVLLDGDFISRKGALTGGYVDQKFSKMLFYRKRSELVQEIANKEGEIVALQSDIGKIDSELNTVLGELIRQENLIRRSKDTFEQMKLDLVSRKHEIQRYEQQKPQKEASIRSLAVDIEQLKSKREMLQSELGTELVKQLSSDDQKVVDELNDKVHKLNQRLKEVLQRLSLIEAEKSHLDNQLKNNFLKKKEDLEKEVAESLVATRSNKIELYSKELELINEKIKLLDENIKNLTNDLNGLNKNELLKYEKKLEDFQDQERKMQHDLQESTVDLEKVSSKLSLLLKKKDECLKATRNLGVLPSDAYEKYSEMSSKELYFKLDNCNQELKKLSHVNKKAMDQYIQFSEHKEKLLQRREEAERAYKSILDFINTLDQRKNENMQMTFKQVSKNFNEIFLKLVPQGTAHLVMRRNDNFEEEDRTSQANEASVEEYSGVGIRVSFTGKSNEMKEIQQLSGGQKTLVALTLIFAIQRCDPAPFYLFDEIDQALDPQYRKAVADMIHELCEKAQFITTTFRPEMLEHANKFYGVRFRNKVSFIDCVTKEEAFDFVEDDQTHK
ncbi:structural maintenance of chromosomes 3-like [Brachionus plicatilis]|uniref:Structural maintenance of chromosomes protein n=1 Tax=Brachionus plicatilis TaxID=10195 RepID=A0A3M7R869_BRAPC|nr:structural maintenance of chromosomes 3-like [Brachionus plicatilis]